MGALTDQRKRCFADSSLYHSSTGAKKPRLPTPPLSSSPATRDASPPKPAFSISSSSLPLPNPLRRTVHAPQRANLPFGLGSSPTPRQRPSSAPKMGNFLSQFCCRKPSESHSLEEYKKLVESHCSSPGDEGNKVSPGVLELTMVAGSDIENLDSLFVGDGKVDDSRKMVSLSTLVREFREDRVLVRDPIYKDLYEKSKLHDANIKNLNFLVKVEEQKSIGHRMKALLLRRKTEQSLKEDYEVFRTLTPDEEKVVFDALNGGNSNEVLVTHKPSNIEITGEILQCLSPGAWLNDEVINLYLELLKEREKREPKKFLKCHFFNTFFYKKLISERHGYDFKAVKRWTTQRKLGYALVECDKIFVPIHKEIHWCLAVINVKNESLQYLDSLGHSDSYVLQVLAQYLKDEAGDKSAKEIDTMSWKKESVDGLPLQKNGWDCGMFMLKYTDFCSRGLKLSFTQEHMPYFRKRTAKEILRLRAE
ncbi:hypothetical protein HPP92_013240 [Vanilla planifolia]|uniref:Ubiquitin-like protease family profile domain-containing protein n=1 Tax=Vanilla planifolia TaxID=51239 RepID=A0A835QRZ1_VANPL|nr:hypothetical protein HPP92_013240 [Vanilla planifolia]